jgi:hypothetical protein
MYNFVNCLQFNIRYEKVERAAPVGGALVISIGWWSILFPITSSDDIARFFLDMLPVIKSNLQSYTYF